MSITKTFSFLVVLVLMAGCGKGPKRDSIGSGVPKVDPASLRLVTETEERERGQFKEKIRSMAFQDQFVELENLARELETNKTRFRNGDWKLRSFYLAFGELAENAERSSWEMLIAKTEAWAAKNPKSAAARIASAEVWRGYAWVARSSREASTVGDEAWRLMADRLTRASRAADEARRLNPNCPHVYAITQRIALGAGLPREKYDEVFERGLKAAPDYSSLYEYKAYFLLPRWYGEPMEWENFAKDTMQRSELPGSKEAFARIALYLRQLGYFYQEFSLTDKSWDLLKESFREMEKAHPESLETRSIFALICGKFCDYKELRVQLLLIDNEVDLSVWGSKENFLGAVNWASISDEQLELARAQFLRNRRK